MSEDSPSYMLPCPVNPALAGHDQGPQQDEKREHLQRRPNRLPPFKPVQFRLQERLVIWGVFEAEHDRSGLGGREEVTNGSSRCESERQQKSRECVLGIGNSCGDEGEQGCADGPHWVDHPPVTQIVASRKGSIGDIANAVAGRELDEGGLQTATRQPPIEGSCDED